VVAWKPQGIVFVGTAPDSIWRRNVDRGNRPQPRNPLQPIGPPIFLVIRAIALQPVVSRLGGDLSAAQSATSLAVQSLGGAQLHVHARIRIVGGEEKGLWGSAYFSDHPAVPISNIVADLNIDMIGRNWKDTIVAIGKEHSDLGATLNRVGAAHAELNMRPIDDIWPAENFY